ncbi:DNA polymerase I [Natronoarchaeum philippinense]|uniref:DNA polymerase n=1 Tax=Natronoarchaeum philippinense TaxID=558529 RepID=A0A285N7G8_NATPI|nr:DNA polymerase domain-containing protein [Natronoarchaeum philippinense]SNZ05268.1 DNA polymerase I [Natronoarchaeum philippinense]
MTDSGTAEQMTFGDIGSGADDADDGRDAHAAAEARAVAGDGGGDGIETIDPSREGVDAKYGEPADTKTLAVMQVDYTIEGNGQNERPIMHVFGRDADDEPEHVKLIGFRPYFYAPTDSLGRPPEDEYDVLTGSTETDEDGEPFESIRGERLTKIFGRTPRDVGNVRDEFDHFEADILFPNRFLIDKDVESGIEVPLRRDEDGALIAVHDEVEAVEAAASPRVNAFDIEVDDRHGFPEPEDAEQPIVCLTSHDSYDDEYVVWLYDAPVGGVDAPEALDGYDPMAEDADYEVRTFDSEEAMLRAFVEYITTTDPDVLTGWNFEDFDAPYLVNRLENLGLSYDRLSRVNEVWAGGWGGPDIKGRVVFDLLYAYKRTQFTELESYRLDAVGEQELGVGKERYTGDIGDLWEQDPERLLEYNLRDVELCVELDRKQDIVAFWDEVRSFVGCKLEDAPTPGDAVDMYVLHKVHGDFALPSKGRHEGEDYEGGAVFDPITGVRENVTVLDLKSLYPMCMVTTNASPETKVDPESYDGETYRAPNGTHFRKEPDGIIREMVDELLSEREEKKSLRNENDPDSQDYERFDRQQAAVKVIMNSLYGVLGWDRFRLYDKEMGAAVTATGRDVIEFTETAANDLGHQVIYGDSVTGDRPVVVRDPDSMMRVVPIEQLFERADTTTESELLITADGGPVASASLGKDRREIDGWEALSLSDDGNPEWQPIEQVIRHETDKPVVDVQHKFGESTTTRDHSFVVEEDDDFVEASPEDLDEPLRIPGVPSLESVETIDVYEVLRGYTREYKDGRSVGSEDAETKVKRIHADEEYVWFGHEHHGSLDSTIKVQRHVDPDSEDGKALVRLLAAYVTEGSASTVETTDRKFGASISESRSEWLKGLQTDYERLFEGATASIIVSDSSDERVIEDGDAEIRYDDQTRKLQMMNELSAVFFREFAGQTSRGKRIPSFVYHLSNELQELFLEVLVEGDGSREFPRYSDEYCQRNFDFETTSRKLVAGLSMLLTQRGRKHSFKYRESKKSYTIRTCDYYRSGRDPVVHETDHDGHVYDLSVAENQNFVDAVGGVVLHNTDSVMLELGPEISKDDAIDQSFEIEEHINDAYDEFAREELNADEHRFQIEFEKLYRRFFQAGTKKRYAGHIVWKEGKDVDDIDITGFEYQRSDIAPITKEVQLEVITRIVRGEDIEDVKDYVHEVIQRVQSGDVSLDEIGIPGGIGKKLDNYDTDTAQVRGAKYANMLLGTNFASGSKPKRLYLQKVHPDFFERVESEDGLNPQTDALYGEFKRDPDVICFEYEDQIPEEFEVDYEKMLDKTLKGPIARVLEALDISWEEVKSGQEQTGLGSFM